MDFWEIVCRFLSYEDICNLGLTCKSILAVTRRPKVYEILLCQYFKKKRLSCYFHSFPGGYRDLYKNFHYKGAFATHLSVVPATKNIVALVELPLARNYPYTNNYIVFSNKPLDRSSVLTYYDNYVTNIRNGAHIKIKSGVYLTKEIKDSDKPKSWSIGILDHKELTLKYKDIVDKVFKISDKFFMFYTKPEIISFNVKTLIFIREAVCKIPILFDRKRTIRCEVLRDVHLIFDPKTSNYGDIDGYMIKHDGAHLCQLWDGL